MGRRVGSLSAEASASTPPSGSLAWGTAQAALAATSLRQRAFLLLLARLPFLWADAAAQFAGYRSASRTYLNLAALESLGLVYRLRACLWPYRVGAVPELYYPSDLGLACVALATDTEPSAVARLRPVTRRQLRRALEELPQLAACYRLAADLAAERQGVPNLLEWSRPWGPAARVPAAARRMPAYAAIAWRAVTNVSGDDGAPCTIASVERYALLPDLQIFPVEAYRSALAALARHHAREREYGARAPTLVIATTTGRARAWAELLRVAGRSARDIPPIARIVRVGRRGLETLGGTCNGHPDMGYPVRPSGGLPGRTAPAPRWRPRGDSRPIPRPVGGPLGTRDRAGTPAQLTDAALWLLDAIARHPFLPLRHLAAYAGWSVDRTQRCRAALIRAGLARLLTAAEVGTAAARAGLVELTIDGLAAAAAVQGLPLRAAVRHNGLAGGGPANPIGGRGGLVGERGIRLRHTVGTDAVFVRFHRWARANSALGGDDALVEWRGPGACSEGYAHPDGFGVYVRGGRAHGFFLEYDRRTMKRQALERKFQRYHRYRELRAYDRRYRGLPWILVVTRDPAAEELFVRALADVTTGRLPLPVLLTTRAQLDRWTEGPLAPIWRDPNGDANGERRCWLPVTTRQRGQLALAAASGRRDLLSWEQIERLGASPRARQLVVATRPSRWA